MKYILSRYNHKVSWVKDYTDDVVIYDRSETPLEGSIVVPNIGSDWHDKLTYIIDNYDNLPDVAVYTKANLFDFIKPREFEKIKDNRMFTPILSLDHHTYEPTCRYKDGMYEEINNRWYLATHPCKNDKAELELLVMLDMSDKEYVQFAPGSNYILPKGNILKHSKEFYQKLRSYLEWDVYPGEAQILERGAYYLWK